jgi:hypothetical protein
MPEDESPPHVEFASQNQGTLPEEISTAVERETLKCRLAFSVRRSSRGKAAVRYRRQRPSRCIHGSWRRVEVCPALQRAKFGQPACAHPPRTRRAGATRFMRRCAAHVQSPAQAGAQPFHVRILGIERACGRDGSNTPGNRLASGQSAPVSFRAPQSTRGGFRPRLRQNNTRHGAALGRAGSRRYRLPHPGGLSVPVFMLREPKRQVFFANT